MSAMSDLATRAEMGDVLAADQIFDIAFDGSPNFMTPDVLERGFAGDENAYAFELSSGDGIFGPIFGVTLLSRQGERTELSQSFGSELEARVYLLNI